MSDTKHTPGKWVAFDNAGPTMESYYQTSGVHSADGKKIICGCFSDIGGKKVAAANARLIATACNNFDALLEACKAALAMMDSMDEIDPRCTHGYGIVEEKLFQAIAAAEREEDGFGK